MTSATLLPSVASADTWTVLGYIAADNSLEPFAVKNVTEMTKVGTTANVRVVLQLDRSLKHSQAPLPGLANFAGTRRLRVDPGQVTEVQDLGDVDMTQPETIADFIAWGIQNYPADHYALVLWDHGGGWQGCCEDEVSPGRMWTPLPDIALGVKQGLQLAGRPKLELLGFDECLMASVEVAHALMPVADIMVASEETEPGEGWNYEAILNAIVGNPSITSSGLGRAIADSYAANVGANSKDASFTLSVLDLAKIPALVTAIDGMSTALSPLAQGSWMALGKPRGDADGFGRQGQDDPFGAIDLGQFVDGVGVSHPDSKAATDAVRQALDAAVLYKVQGSAHANTNGLSIYLPERQVANAYTSLEFAMTQWGSFLGAYTTGASGDTTPPDLTMPVEQSTPMDGTTELIADTQATDIDDVSLIVATDNPDGSATFLGAVPTADPEGGKVHATLDRKEWPHLTDGTSTEPVPFFNIKTFQESGAPHALVAAIAEVAPDAMGWRTALLLFDMDTATRAATFIGAYEAGTDGASEVDLQAAGAKVRPAVLTVQSTGDFKLASGTKELAASGIALKPLALAAGKYHAGFLAQDYAGNSSSSLAKIAVGANGSSMPANAAGCSCQAGPSDPGAPAAFAIPLLAVLARRRERRRSTR